MFLQQNGDLPKKGAKHSRLIFKRKIQLLSKKIFLYIISYKGIRQIQES